MAGSGLSQAAFPVELRSPVFRRNLAGAGGIQPAFRRIVGRAKDLRPRVGVLAAMSSPLFLSPEWIPFRPAPPGRSLAFIFFQKQFAHFVITECFVESFVDGATRAGFWLMAGQEWTWLTEKGPTNAEVSPRSSRRFGNRLLSSERPHRELRKFKILALHASPCPLTCCFSSAVRVGDFVKREQNRKRLVVDLLSLG